MSGILYISCGVPGSGKSTFLNDMKDNGEKIISRDEIRFSLLKPGEDYFSHEKETYTKFINSIVSNINNNINVYADATHLNPKSRYALLKQIFNRGCKPREINAIYFKVPLEICKERNNLRKGTKTYVPEDQVLKMFSDYEYPSYSEFFGNTNGGTLHTFNNIWEVNSEGDITYIEKKGGWI